MEEKVPERKNAMLTRVVMIVIKKLKQVMKIVMQKGPQVSLLIEKFPSWLLTPQQLAMQYGSKLMR